MGHVSGPPRTTQPAVYLAYAKSLVPAGSNWAAGFTCPRCGLHPEVVVADGTKLIFQSKLMPDMRSREGEILSDGGRCVCGAAGGLV